MEIVILILAIFVAPAATAENNEANSGSGCWWHLVVQQSHDRCRKLIFQTAYYNTKRMNMNNSDTSNRSSPLHVSFASDETSITYHENQYRYSDFDIEACWYTPKEEELILLEIRNTIKLIRMKTKLGIGRCLDNDVVCTRGLENVSKHTIDASVQSVQAVLLEQAIQLSKRNAIDHNKIASVYEKKTRRSQALAKLLGHVDQSWALSNTISRHGEESPVFETTASQHTEGINRQSNRQVSSRNYVSFKGSNVSSTYREESTSSGQCRKRTDCVSGFPLSVTSHRPVSSSAA